MFDAADTVGKSMRILAGVISTLSVRQPESFLRILLADEYAATDLPGEDGQELDT